MEKNESEAVRKAREGIEKALDSMGNYTHNIISLYLSSLAAEEGNEAANKLVDEYDLTELFGIQKVEE